MRCTVSVLTNVGKVLVGCNLHASKGAFNHYRLIKYIAKCRDIDLHSRRLGAGARSLRLSKEDRECLAHLGVYRTSTSEIRFTDSFGILRRRGLLIHKGKGIYKVSPKLRNLLSPEEAATEETENSEGQDTTSEETNLYMDVTIRMRWNPNLEDYIGLEKSYSIGGTAVSKEEYEEFLSNNASSPALLALAKSYDPKMPMLWGKVRVLKVEKAN